MSKETISIICLIISFSLFLTTLISDYKKKKQINHLISVNESTIYKICNQKISNKEKVITISQQLNLGILDSLNLFTTYIDQKKKLRNKSRH